MPGFFASNALMASSTKVRFGISAAQWLQNVNSLTCCAAAGPVRHAADTSAANTIDGVFACIGFLLPWIEMPWRPKWVDLVCRGSSVGMHFGRQATDLPLLR